jgi:hypothetical protein
MAMECIHSLPDCGIIFMSWEGMPVMTCGEEEEVRGDFDYDHWTDGACFGKMTA